MTATELIAAAASDAPVNQFSTSDTSQRWVDLLASSLDGLVLVTFALLFVWCAHRLNLNRWFLITAVLATVFALIASGLIHEHIAPIFALSEKVLEMTGFGRFFYLAIPAIFVCFGSALAHAWWCKHRERKEVAK